MRRAHNYGPHGRFGDGGKATGQKEPFFKKPTLPKMTPAAAPKPSTGGGGLKEKFYQDGGKVKKEPGPYEATDNPIGDVVRAVKHYVKVGHQVQPHLLEKDPETGGKARTYRNGGKVKRK